MKSETGGPAFPSTRWNAAVEQMVPTGGMTLRDWFAGMAMQGMMTRDAFDPGQASPEQRAALAYTEADAMLAQRDK